jgi:alpha-amylase
MTTISISILVLSLGFLCNAQWLTETLPDRQTYVHLFEWKWADIANECETFLGKYKYGAVQIAPPNEHVMTTANVEGKDDIPWYVKYQPVSYKLNRTRSGTYEELVDMINRCNKAGVRIIVDAVINHMTSVTMKYPGQLGVWSSAGSKFDGTTGDFPSVPYTYDDFHNNICNGDIGGDCYGRDAACVRNCRLVSLIDLNHSRKDVRDKIVTFLNELVDLGVAGFRVDAVKHMWPGDMQYMMQAVKNLRSDIFGENQRPFVVQEVPIQDDSSEIVKVSEYLPIGRITDFKYGNDVSAAVRRQKNFKYFWNFGPGWGHVASDSSLPFIDNHDTQRDTPVLTYKYGDQYIMASTYMLAWPYGYPSVMSSYYFNQKNQGPPNTFSPDWTVTSPTFNPDETCKPESGWVCEHRWPAIRRMVVFRSVTQGQDSYAFTDEHRIAFRRGNKGFFALNNQDAPWDWRFDTTMPPGTYCDVISGEVSDGRCTGITIKVDNDGGAQIKVAPGKTLAIHVGQKIQ